MTILQETCDCGSGVDYDECSCRRGEMLNKLDDPTNLLRSRFRAAVQELRDVAVRRLGRDALTAWASATGQTSLFESELRLFGEFVMLHLPFRFLPSLARWCREQGLGEEIDWEVVELVGSQPYRLLQVEEPDELFRHVTVDTLTGESFLVEPQFDMRDAATFSLYGKLVEFEGRHHLVSCSTVYPDRYILDHMTASIVIELPNLVARDLLDPPMALRLYQEWRLGMERWSEDGDDENPDELVHSDTFNYDPRTEGWVVHALREHPRFELQDSGLFLFEEGEVQVSVEVGGGELIAQSCAAVDCAPFASVLEDAVGGLLEYDGRETYDPGQVEAQFWGALSPGAFFVETEPDYPDDEGGTLESPRPVSPLRLVMPDEDGLEDDPTVLEVLEAYLGSRAQAVSATTFRRDLQAVEFLREFLDGQVGHREQGLPSGRFCIDEPYHAMFDHLGRFLEFCQEAPLKMSPSQQVGLCTAMRVFVRWLEEQGLLDDADLMD